MTCGSTTAPCPAVSAWQQSGRVTKARQTLAKRRLRLIADAENRIRANREIGPFTAWQEQYDDLQRVSISRFSAGRWSCQRRDQRFAGIDAQRIDLSKPENLFKAVYRVVLRQNHLTLARWNAHFTGPETEEGRKRFKETAFHTPVSDEVAEKAENEWRNEAHAVMGRCAILSGGWQGENGPRLNAGRSC